MPSNDCCQASDDRCHGSDDCCHGSDGRCRDGDGGGATRRDRSGFLDPRTRLKGDGSVRLTVKSGEKTRKVTVALRDLV